MRDISFSLYEGEVLGITGLIGSGCSELAKTMFGCEGIARECGEYEIRGAKVALNNTWDALAHGIAFITNDRINEGLLPAFSLYDNICLPILTQFANTVNLLDTQDMIRRSSEYVELLNIKTPNVMVAAETLSGGNQQKVVIAKWLATNPSIFIMDEPTIGIDVGAKYEIRKLIRDISQKGVGVMLITTEIEELEKLCDRVLVMFRGEIVAELINEDIQKEKILAASMNGGKP